MKFIILLLLFTGCATVKDKTVQELKKEYKELKCISMGSVEILNKINKESYWALYSDPSQQLLSSFILFTKEGKETKGFMKFLRHKKVRHEDGTFFEVAIMKHSHGCALIDGKIRMKVRYGD